MPPRKPTENWSESYSRSLHQTQDGSLQHRPRRRRTPGVFTLNTKHHPGKIWVSPTRFLVDGIAEDYFDKARREGSIATDRLMLSRRLKMASNPSFPRGHPSRGVIDIAQ